MLKIKPIKIRDSVLALCFVLFFNLYTAYGQKTIKDSLYQKIESFKLKLDYQKDTLYINSLYTYGKAYGFYNLDSLNFLANETIELSKAINFTIGEAKGHIILGNYYSETGEKELAIENYSKAKSIAEANTYIDVILLSKSSLATAYIYKEEYTKALQEYLSAIEIATQNEDDDSLAILNINISVIYSLQNDYEECIYFLSKAMEYNKKTGNERLTAVTQINMASSYIGYNKLDKATEKVDAGLPILEKLELQDWITYAYELKATIFYKQENASEALLWYKKSEKIHENIEQKRYKISLYSGMAETYLKLKDYDHTEVYGLKALALSDELNLLDERDDILNTLYELKKETNQAAAALGYLEAFKAISDTINKKNNQKELNILKSNLAFDQEKERYILENEKEAAKQRLYFYGALLIIISFSIIIYILKRNNRTQNILNKKLTVKTRQLQDKEKHLVNSNHTKTKLFAIIAHDLRGPINSFKSMFDLFTNKQINDAEFIELAPTMGESIDSIAFTLNNLLSWGQTQMKDIVTEPEHTNISDLVNQNNALLSKMAEKKSISFENNVTESALTWSGKNQISIVIRNLTSNALKFTPEHGKITFGATDKQNHWEFYIKDTGVGLTEEALHKIFSTKETFSTYGTNNEKGTGLGLVLCKEMIEKNNGRIWAESTINVGTIFYFTLPKAE
ncbi:ATP-binding protein [Cellulophaga sp. Z1A5H]|uniref:tetratricopeptide repeat-containing sensor histidine kinase n=1 Tax=Cellulophaga sp. Z1A5H TaxID=2687291 RepID=UPI0013FD2FC7|nr:ATP-binding protein [Cellulophaga sp. Z1A5H]